MELLEKQIHNLLRNYFALKTCGILIHFSQLLTKDVLRVLKITVSDFSFKDTYPLKQVSKRTKESIQSSTTPDPGHHMRK